MRGGVPVVLLAILAPFQSKLDTVSSLELREVSLKTAGLSGAKLPGIVTAAHAIDIDGGEPQNAGIDQFCVRGWKSQFRQVETHRQRVGVLDTYEPVEPDPKVHDEARAEGLDVVDHGSTRQELEPLAAGGAVEVVEIVALALIYDEAPEQTVGVLEVVIHTARVCVIGQRFLFVGQIQVAGAVRMAEIRGLRAEVAEDVLGDRTDSRSWDDVSDERRPLNPPAGEQCRGGWIVDLVIAVDLQESGKIALLLGVGRDGQQFGPRTDRVPSLVAPHEECVVPAVEDVGDHQGTRHCRIPPVVGEVSVRLPGLVREPVVGGQLRTHVIVG